jgi:hypothetical protein
MLQAHTLEPQGLYNEGSETTIVLGQLFYLSQESSELWIFGFPVHLLLLAISLTVEPP